MKKIIMIGFLSLTVLYSKHLKDPLASKLNHMLIHKKDSNKIFNKDKYLISTAKKYLGTRYKYGANSRYAVDCSSFVQQVYKKHSKNIPRTSREQSKIGKFISRSKLKPGDLVFFSSKKTKGVAHVGIYIGSNKFIHASSAKKRVVITELNKKYYAKHYKGARRI